MQRARARLEMEESRWVLCALGGKNWTRAISRVRRRTQLLLGHQPRHGEDKSLTF